MSLTPTERTRRWRLAQRMKRAGTARFEVYADAARLWRWRLIAANGQRVASSGEAFASKSNAQRAVDDVVAIVLAGPAVVTL